jgi:hypothetical protein
MEHVIVERVFAEPVDLPELTRRYKEGIRCFELRNVSHLRTTVSRDGRRMICEYSAPDAESVREANEAIDLPYAHIWTALRPAEP